MAHFEEEPFPKETMVAAGLIYLNAWGDTEDLTAVSGAMETLARARDSKIGT